MFIIDLALSIVEFNFLTIWEIFKDYPLFSNHKLILLYWENISYNLLNKKDAIPIGWGIYGFTKFADDLESAHLNWISQNRSQKSPNKISNPRDLDKKVDWVEENLARVLNAHAKILGVTFFSKQWWNKEVAEVRKTWAIAKRIWETGIPDKIKLK